MKVTLLISFIILLGQSKLVFGQKAEVQTILSDVKLDSLTQFVKQLSGVEPVVIDGKTDTIKTRFSYGNGNEKAYKYMRGLFTQYGLVVDSFIFSANGKNLFGTKKGYKYPDRIFMIGAHYDNAGSWPIAPGADDNASGTAAVLEAARIFSKYDFPYTIVFVLWDEEEQGALGSKYYTATIKGRPETFMGYINMDMLGWDGNNDTVADIHVRPVANSMQLAERAQSCNLKYQIGLNIHVFNPGSPATDHYPFWENNLTSIGIDEEYDKDFNPYWHTPADSIGHFNLDFFQRCAKLAYATLAECATDTISTLGVFEDMPSTEVSIWPNPFQSDLNIHFEKGNIRPMRVEIFNVNGTTIIQEFIESNGNSYHIKFPEKMGKGLYYVRIFNDENILIKKIIKQ